MSELAVGIVGLGNMGGRIATRIKASFGLALGLGYGDLISNRVVDATGDVAGGVRVSAG
jgi:3-hydroxyisobutyrate dehydrogenase